MGLQLFLGSWVIRVDSLFLFGISQLLLELLLPLFFLHLLADGVHNEVKILFCLLISILVQQNLRFYLDA